MALDRDGHGYFWKDGRPPVGEVEYQAAIDRGELERRDEAVAREEGCAGATLEKRDFHQVMWLFRHLD